jgi:threonine/homoserine/homoserine lactone efflux protein
MTLFFQAIFIGLVFAIIISFWGFMGFIAREFWRDLTEKEKINAILFLGLGGFITEFLYRHSK